MHAIVLLTILGMAWGIRYTWVKATPAPSCLSQTWERTLAIFLLPPLLLLTSALAIVWMGPHGRMVWVGNDWVSYDLAIGLLGIAALCWCQLARSGWQLCRQIRTYPIVTLQGHRARLLDLPAPYSAQIGFWEPELTVTTGLLTTLTTEQLAAVLAHEQAHYYYRDTWWFFWLGWVRQLTPWLPHTEAIWQELLMLRELRADLWAADRTDPLLVAEALLSIVQNTPVFTENICAAFSQLAPIDRLSQRIEALLGSESASCDLSPDWLLTRSWLLVSLLPLLAVPFHR
jgi:hypothetical protein